MKLLKLWPKLRIATQPNDRKVLSNAVTATELKIDNIVYELYGLTPEERAIIANADGTISKFATKTTPNPNPT